MSFFLDLSRWTANDPNLLSCCHSKESGLKVFEFPNKTIKPNEREPTLDKKRKVRKIEYPKGFSALECNLKTHATNGIVSRIIRFIYEFFIKMGSPTKNVLQFTKESIGEKEILKNLKKRFPNLHPVLQVEAAKTYIGGRLEMLIKEQSTDFPSLVEMVGKDFEKNFLGSEEFGGVNNFEFLSETIIENLNGVVSDEMKNSLLVCKNAFEIAKKIKDGGEINFKSLQLSWWSRSKVDMQEATNYLDSMISSFKYFDDNPQLQKKAFHSLCSAFRLFLVDESTKKIAEENIKKFFLEVPREMVELSLEPQKNEIVLSQGLDEILKKYYDSDEEKRKIISNSLEDLKSEINLPKKTRENIDFAVKAIKSQKKSGIFAVKAIKSQKKSGILNFEDCITKLLDSEDVKQFLKGPLRLYEASLPEEKKVEIKEYAADLMSSAQFLKLNKNLILSILDKENPEELIEELLSNHPLEDLVSLYRILFVIYKMKNEKKLVYFLNQMNAQIEMLQVEKKLKKFKGKVFDDKFQFEDGVSFKKEVFSDISRDVVEELKQFKLDMIRSPRIFIEGCLYVNPESDTVYNKLLVDYKEKAGFIAAAITQTGFAFPLATLQNLLLNYQINSVNILLMGNEMMEYEVKRENNDVIITSKVVFKLGLEVVGSGIDIKNAGFVPVIRQLRVPIEEIPTLKEINSQKTISLPRAEASFKLGKVYSSIPEASKVI